MVTYVLMYLFGHTSFKWYRNCLTCLTNFQVAAPKKDPKAKKLSENVQKFLDRRKAEEDRKKQEDERQKNNLKKLRADSKESQKVVSCAQ